MIGRSPLLLGAALVCVLAFSARAEDVGASADRLFDRTRDRILQRSEITSRGRKHGEVRIVERGPVRVVQTLLYTKLLRRVLAEIRDRERASWPEPGDGFEASKRYLEALAGAEQSIARSTLRDSGARGDRRRSVLIEFAISSSDAAVALLAPDVDEVEGKLTISGMRGIEVLRLPREFVRRDMRLIAEEHFPSLRDALPRLLEPSQGAD